MKKLKEMINLPIEIGDTIMTGKFKNKKTVVKSIEVDDEGEVTVNGKRILRVRIPRKITISEIKQIVHEELKKYEDASGKF